MAKRDETLQALVNKVDMLHDAFDSLSDVVTYEVEEMHKKIAATASQLEARVAKLENTFQKQESEALQTDGKLEHALEQRFLHVQEMCAKIELALYESQAELALVKQASENLMTREREAAQSQKSLQISQGDAAETLKRLEEKTSQFEEDLVVSNEQAYGATTRMARDVQVLAEAFSALRATVARQQSTWSGKLNALQEILDGQGKRDKAQLHQRVDALSDAMIAQEFRTKNAIDGLVKRNDQIRGAIDAIQNDQKKDLDQVVRQMARSCGHRHDELDLSLQSIARRLKVCL